MNIAAFGCRPGIEREWGGEHRTWELEDGLGVGGVSGSAFDLDGQEG